MQVIALVGAMICIPISIKLAKRWGKGVALARMLGVISFFFIVFGCIFLPGVIRGAPEMIYFMALILGFALALPFGLPDAILADIIDYDEVRACACAARINSPANPVVPREDAARLGLSDGPILPSALSLRMRPRALVPISRARSLEYAPHVPDAQFLTGERNEGMYTVIEGNLQQFVEIAGGVIPLMILTVAGYKPLGGCQCGCGLACVSPRLLTQCLPPHSRHCLCALSSHCWRRRVCLAVCGCTAAAPPRRWACRTRAGSARMTWATRARARLARTFSTSPSPRSRRALCRTTA